jgi:asparagine synthase (glutamine-hydrolysing)
LFNKAVCNSPPHPYWQLECREHTDSLEDTIEKVRYLVQDTVVRQLVSDVPICTFLSGGLDSSAITAIAAGHFKEHGLGQLHTYSIDYRGNDKYFKPSHFQPDPDSMWVGVMSERFGTQHHYYEIDGAGPLADALEDAALARDLPGMADVDSSLLLFCREIKKEHVVSLSGECADEIFGGYPWFHDVDLQSDWFPWMRDFSLRRSILSQDLVEYTRPEEYVAMRYHESIARVPRLAGEDPQEAKRREIFYLNMQWFMAMLLVRKDRMSMATGLEVRVPFCDHRLAGYVWNIPWEMKALHGREKGILREALRGLLPDEIVNRKKSPYPKTHDPLYESLVKSRLQDVLSGTSPLLNLINVAEVRRLMDTPSDLGRPWFGQLMALPQLFAWLIQADIWMQKYHVTVV